MVKSALQMLASLVGAAAIVFILQFLYLSVAYSACDFPVPSYKINEVPGVHAIAKNHYNQMLNEIEAAYAPVFKAKGMKLKVHRPWADGTVNAQAWLSGSTCNIEMFGGLARFPGITPRAFQMVAMHEIGHCLGGAPYYPGERMSAEGQADYYSTNVACKLLGIGCKDASLNLAQSLAKMSRDSKPYRPGNKLPSVRETDVSHPAAQCRLNTYDAGSIGARRPSCWYRE